MRVGVLENTTLAHECITHNEFYVVKPRLAISGRALKVSARKAKETLPQMYHEKGILALIGR